MTANVDQLSLPLAIPSIRIPSPLTEVAGPVSLIPPPIVTSTSTTGLMLTLDAPPAHLAKRVHHEKSAYSIRLHQLFLPQVPPCPKSEFVAVGHARRERNLELLRVSREAVELAKDESIHPMIRAAIGWKHPDEFHPVYFIDHMDPEVAKMLTAFIRSGAIDHERVLTDILPHMHCKNFRYVPPSSKLTGKALAEYLIQLNTRRVAVFKPFDEVTGMANALDRRDPFTKYGVQPRWEGRNEVIVSGLFPSRRIPAGIETKMTGPFWDATTGSDDECRKPGVLQEFVPQSESLVELSAQKDFSRIPSKTVQELAIVTLLTGETDCHLGNLLYSRLTRKVHFIDHALILSAQYSNPGELSWMAWPQALEPFSESAVSLIMSRSFEDERRDIQEAYPTYPEESLEVLRTNHYLLQRAAEARLPLFAIGWLHTSGYLNSLYRLAKSESHDDPELAFANMTRLIDQTVANLQVHFPRILAEVQAAKYPPEKFSEALTLELGCNRGLIIPTAIE
jgi:hypothetical protein